MARKPKYKQYVGISRDHSGSMQSYSRAAAKDYNNTIASIKDESGANKIETIVSVIACGIGYAAKNERVTVYTGSQFLTPLDEREYKTDGSRTPLFDSVNELINILSAAPDADGKNVTFLVVVVTDGEDNASHISGHELGQKIKKLQASDRWTFTFRVPKGYKNHLVAVGIPEGNVLEWEASSKGLEVSSQVTKQAFRGFYAAQASGQRSTTRFYADMSSVKPADVRSEMKNITKDVVFWPVKATASIRDFVEKKLRKSMTIGCAFYQLTKSESAVQDYKLICIRNRNSHAVYGGDAAREILGLPKSGNIKLSPGNHGEFDIFVQSTSTNRKLMPSTEVLYWSNALAK